MNQHTLMRQLQELVEDAVNERIADRLDEQHLAEARALRRVRGDLSARLAQQLQERYIIRTPKKR